MKSLFMLALTGLFLGGCYVSVEDLFHHKPHPPSGGGGTMQMPPDASSNEADAGLPPAEDSGAEDSGMDAENPPESGVDAQAPEEEPMMSDASTPEESTEGAGLPEPEDSSTPMEEPPPPKIAVSFDTRRRASAIAVINENTFIAQYGVIHLTDNNEPVTRAEVLLKSGVGPSAIVALGDGIQWCLTGSTRINRDGQEILVLDQPRTSSGCAIDPDEGTTLWLNVTTRGATPNDVLEMELVGLGTASTPSLAVPDGNESVRLRYRKAAPIVFPQLLETATPYDNAQQRTAVGRLEDGVDTELAAWSVQNNAFGGPIQYPSTTFVMNFTSSDPSAFISKLRLARNGVEEPGTFTVVGDCVVTDGTPAICASQDGAHRVSVVLGPSISTISQVTRFSIRGLPNGVVSDDSLNVTLERAPEGEMVLSSLMYDERGVPSLVGAAGSFLWSDLSAPDHSDSSADWTNDIGLVMSGETYDMVWNLSMP